MREGKLDGQYLACWVRQGPCDEENSLKAIDRVDELIRHIYRQVEMNGEQCAIARTPDDLSRLKTEGKKAFYIGIENGYGIGKDLKNITRSMMQALPTSPFATPATMTSATVLRTRLPVGTA